MPVPDRRIGSAAPVPGVSGQRVPAPRADPKASRAAGGGRPDAQRWLSFLAHQMQRRLGGTTDLAWWELPRAAPPGLVGLTVGIASGLAVGLLIAFAAPLTQALGAHNETNVGMGPGLGILLAFAVALPLRRVGPSPTIPSGLAGGVLGGLAGGLAAGVANALGVGYAAWPAGGLGPGLAVGLAVGPASGWLGGLVGAGVPSCSCFWPPAPSSIIGHLHDRPRSTG